MDINKIYELPFPVSQVYSAWVSSNTVISPATAMDINPTVGGHYRLLIKSPEFNASNEGKFLIVEPEQHLRYTWEWNNDGEVTEIDVRFVYIASGCQIKLTHNGFTKQESADMHSTGWDSYINGLTDFLRA